MVAAKPETDADLMRAVARGDSAAMSRVIRACGGMVYKVAFAARVPSPEDFAQDVWMLVYRQAGRYDMRRARLVTFVGMIARNTAVDQFRRRRLRAVLLAARGGDDGLEWGETAPSEASELAGLDDLPPKMRDVLSDTYLRGLTLRQQADLYGEPLGTIKSRLSRALTLAREAHPSGA